MAAEVVVVHVDRLDGAASHQDPLGTVDVGDRDRLRLCSFWLAIAGAGDRVRPAVLHHQDHRQVGPETRREARAEESTI
ncbi:MAG: hypothetical protein KF901_32015, partial [Myxococcales bacterium]|nr:hypothetical protein [Myxococcales bacterium]